MAPAEAALLRLTTISQIHQVVSSVLMWRLFKMARAGRKVARLRNDDPVVQGSQGQQGRGQQLLFPLLLFIRERNMSLAQVVRSINFSRTFSRALVDSCCSFLVSSMPVIEGSPHSSELSSEPVPL